MDFSSIEEKLVSLIGKLELLGEQISPEATRAVFSAIHLNAVYSLVQVFIVFIIVVPVFYICIRWLSTFDDDSKPGIVIPAVIISVFSLVVCFILVIIGLGILLSTDTWIALTDPQAALARQLLFKD